MKFADTIEKCFRASYVVFKIVHWRVLCSVIYHPFKKCSCCGSSFWGHCDPNVLLWDFESVPLKAIQVTDSPQNIPLTALCEAFRPEDRPHLYAICGQYWSSSEVKGRTSHTHAVLTTVGQCPATTSLQLWAGGGSQDRLMNVMANKTVARL